MIGAGVLQRVRRRDPHNRIFLRAVRLSLAALPAYYICLYVIGGAVMATYVVFAVISAAAFIQLPGSPGKRAGLLVASLPVVWALIALGSALDRNVWAAVGATLVVGFGFAFFGVGGPRLVGLAGGLQLFFVVANFPPHHPHALQARLLGATIGMVLTAIGEVLLWPDPTPVPYERRLAEAAAAVAGLLEASADVVAGEVAPDGAVALHQARTAEAIERTRMAGLARNEVPTSASRRDRALRDGASATREIAEQVQRFIERPELTRRRYADLAMLMRQCAAAMRRAGRTFAEGRTPPDAAGDGLATPGAEPLSAAARHPGDLEDLHHLRLQMCVRNMVDHVRILAIAADIAVGEPVQLDGERPPGGSGAFWYARHNELTLFWRQFRVHLTPRSVYFQSALRLAVALAGARAVAAEFDLSKGFWVLLGTLTIMRTSAVTTRISLISATGGTLAGAVVTGLLLRFTGGSAAFGVELAFATVLAFAVGPLLGMAWSQAALTVMVTLVFAQLAPTDWSLAGVRLMDVLVGGAVGVAAGLVMWPGGAASELRRRVGAYLGTAADLIGETVATLVNRGTSPEALHAARREFILADASLCQYYSERPDPRMSHVNWDASIAAGHHVVHGAELLLYHHPAGTLAMWPEAGGALTDIAVQLRAGYRDIAHELVGGRISRPVTTPLDGAAIGDRVRRVVAETGHHPQEPCLVDVEEWLSNLSENLDWVQVSSGVQPRPGRQR